MLFCPRHLVECNAETAHHARKVQQRADLALVLREAVIGERVYGEGLLNHQGRDGCRGTHRLLRCSP